jgi:hypothetical protein
MIVSLAITLFASALLVAAGYFLGARQVAPFRTELDTWKVRYAELQEQAAQLEAERNLERRAREAQGASGAVPPELLKSAVADALEPLVKPHQTAHTLGRIQPGPGLAALPRVLQEIAEAGAYRSVVLSDDDGLPIATSTQAQGLEALSGVFSLVVTLADRVAKAGAPSPRAVLLMDTQGQSTLHRLFELGHERYVLSAVRRGSVSPDDLDPALASIETTLGG